MNGFWSTTALSDGVLATFRFATTVRRLSGELLRQTSKAIVSSERNVNMPPNTAQDDLSVGDVFSPQADLHS